MKRRTFIRRAGAGMASGALATAACGAPSEVIRQLAAAEEPGKRPAAGEPGGGASAGPPKRKPALMKVGTQNVGTDEWFGLLAALGVNNICAKLPSATFDAAWSAEELLKLREHVESFGLKLDMLPLPLSSYQLAKAENPNIMAGKSPERDREIDDICQMIRNAARSGIPALKYNMSILGVVRTEPVQGRGGAMYSAFDYQQANERPIPPGWEPVNADEYWQRITYFLERVVPVAQEYKVRLACHPHDPGMPHDTGYHGVHTVLGSVAGLKRFVEIKESKYHGLNFCQGTVSEMLERPGEEIYDVIRYFGSRGKIFNVHFRNIHGGFLKFHETLIDGGDVDMLKALRVYQEVGYDGMMMPDHVPKIPGDTSGYQAFAYSFGYIKALIAALNETTKS